MAVADKLVNLADLKVAYDDNAGKIGDLKSAFEPTQNLWTYGDQLNVSQNFRKAISLTAGEKYTISAKIVSNDTDNANSRIVLSDANLQQTAVGTIAHDGARHSATLTAPTGVGYLYIYASNTSAHSSGDTFSATEIQVEQGTTATEYVPPLSARDSQAREQISQLTNGVVRHDITQALTNEQKERARQNIGAADKSDVEDVIDVIVERNSGNLWVWGNQEVSAGTHNNIRDINLPAGTYTLSAEILKETTANCRMIFYHGNLSGSVASVLLSSDGNRNNITFTASDTITSISIYAAANDTSATPATWENIQMESGSEATEYKPAISAVDYTVRTRVNGLIGDVEDVNSGLNDVRDTLDQITEPGDNLWQWGDQTVEQEGGNVKIVNAGISFEIGEYTLSANIIRDAEANCRMIFYKDKVTSGDVIANPYINADGTRHSATFEITEECTANIIVIFGGLKASVSKPTVWKDIQLEAGSSATDYTPAINAIDSYARSQIAKIDGGISGRQVLITNEAYEGADSFTITMPEYNTFSETPILCCDAMFTRLNDIADYPRIRFKMKNDRDLDRYSTWWKIGRENEYGQNEWRAPAFIWGEKPVNIEITVPQGCTLTIREMWYRFDSSTDRTNARGIQFFARPGNCNMVPELSLPAMQMSLRHGYDAFVVIPKVSSDGTWFAYHDDKFIVSPVSGESKTTLVNADGSNITDTTYDHAYFHQIPWSYLKQFRTGGFGSKFLDQHLMTLDECFSFLAKTGMKIRFSMHPQAGVNETANLRALKRLVQKYGLLKNLSIIVNDISQIFSVFGNDIGEYCFPNVTGSNWTGDTKRVDVSLTDAITAKATYSISVPISCGMWTDALFSDKAKAETLVGDILDEGFAAGAFSVGHTGIDGSSHLQLWSEDIHWLMSIGVTEFTDGYNTSIGLNW